MRAWSSDFRRLVGCGFVRSQETPAKAGDPTSGEELDTEWNGETERDMR